MKIIEKKIISKYENNKKCEDGIFYNNDFIVLVDGATAKGDMLWDGKTSGEYAKDIILNNIELMNYDIEANMFFEKLNEALKEGCIVELSKLSVEESINNRPRASIIVFSKYYNEVWLYGDCQCMINSQIKTRPKKIDDVLSQLRSFIINNMLLTGSSEEEIMANDLAREYIIPFLKMQFEFENKNNEFGYSVLNGFDDINNEITKYKVEKGDKVIFASDGYPILKDTLVDSENALINILEIDPLCFKANKQTKGITKGNISFDDRSYISFII